MAVFHSSVWLTFRCVYVPHGLHPCLYWWTFRLLPGPMYCKQCCHGHRCVHMFLNYGFFFVYYWALVLIIKCEFGKMRTKTVIHGGCLSSFAYSVFLLSLEKWISICSRHHNHLDSFEISDCWASTPVSLGWGWRIFISNRFSGIANASGTGDNGKNEILGHQEMNVRQWQKPQGHNPMPDPDQFVNKWFKHSNWPPEDLKSVH